jgi:hypothetical protein
VAFGKGLAKKKALLGRRFKEGARLTGKDLLGMNCLGMSNTAARLNLLMPALSRVPDSTRAFDWAFFSRVLKPGLSAVFTRRTWTGYRQHGANTASPFLPDEKSIVAAADIKREHYAALRRQGRPYLLLADEFRHLAERLKRDTRFRRDYCAAVRRSLPAHPLWWEPVKPSLEGV